MQIVIQLDTYQCSKHVQRHLKLPWLDVYCVPAVKSLLLHIYLAHRDWLPAGAVSSMHQATVQQLLFSLVGKVYSCNPAALASPSLIHTCTEGCTFCCSCRLILYLQPHVAQGGETANSAVCRFDSELHDCRWHESLLPTAQVLQQVLPLHRSQAKDGEAPADTFIPQA